MMNGITMTREGSLVSVIYDGTLLIIDFPFDRKIINILKKVDGADWSNRIEKKWTIPKNNYHSLKEKFGSKIIWKSQDELKKDTKELTFKEETLDDVLNRLPNDVETPFMKLQPYDFQKLMVAWGITPKGKKANIYGGLLGDLMGLGKTIQALAFSGYLKNNPLPNIPPIKRCLIICPATLKMQWGQEIERFTDEKYVIIDGGTATTKKKAYEKRLDQYKKAQDDDVFYTIVNYELLFQKEKKGTEEIKKGKRKEKKTIWGDYIDLNAILENEYDMIVIDEAQRMRNPETETFKCINQIQSPSIRLLMTGTPIEKDLQNIFPLMDYLSPNILADKRYDFDTRLQMFTDKFLIMGWNEFALRASNGYTKIPEVKGVKNVGMLKRTVAPYMLRRTTEDVSDEMPESTEDTVVVDWSKEQKVLYEMLQEELLMAQESLAQAMKEQKEDEAKRAENELNAIMMYMLEVCNTPELLFQSFSTVAYTKIKKIKKYKKLAEDMLKLIRRYKKLGLDLKEIREETIVVNKKLKNNIGDKANLEIELKELKERATPITNEMKEILDKREKLLTKYKFMPPKLERMIEMVHDVTIENDDKIVIFSKFEKMTKILKREIDKKLNLTSKGRRKKEQIGIVMYTGDVDKTCKWKSELEKEKKEAKNLQCNECPFLKECNSRTKSAWHFQNDPDTRVLIATDAGNYGVNLQSGRYLTNYDLPDSHAVYSQRNGRIKRLGSKHDTVFVYNLVTQGGIDEKKYYKILEQKEIADQVVEKNELEEDAVIRATASMNKSLLKEITKKK